MSPANRPRYPRGRPPAALTPADPLDRLCLALSHRARRAILRLLRSHGQLSGAQLQRAFPLANPSAISAHLRRLREAGLIEARVAYESPLRHYRLVPTAMAELRSWLAACFPDALERSQAAEQVQRQRVTLMEQMVRECSAESTPVERS